MSNLMEKEPQNTRKTQKNGFMEKLLDGVEVEWKLLGEVATITIGEFVHKNNQNIAAQYPVYNGGTSPTGFYDKYNNTGNKIIVSARGANAGFVNRINVSYWAGNSCYSIGVQNTDEINWSFVYYFLKNSENKLIGDQQKGGIPAVSKKQMEVFQIPIPCPENPKKSLEIQAEIVRILDKFIELTAELTARKKQYTYYRDQLLSFEEGDVEWKTLGEVGQFIRGKRFTKADYVDDGISVIHYGEIYTRYGVYTTHSLSRVRKDMAGSLRYAEPGDVVITDVGETVEDVGKAVAWLGDEKVLKFKVDYNDVRPQFKAIESEQDEKKLSAAENKQVLLHPDRIKEVTLYILNNFRQKTHRLQAGAKGFNAMFAVSSVDAAKLYYESFKQLQEESDKPLKAATIFSFAANEEQDAVGDIPDESFDVSAMNSSAKEFLSAAIADYNALFKTNFGVDSNGFQNYYRDLAKRVKSQEIDLLIVVGMFLTGFDAPTLNTLFVDKNLCYHGLMQAYSRTNRIYDATKTFGNIVTFRDLEQATIDAITLFGDKNTKNVVLEKSYKEYMEGFTDVVTGEARRGYMEVVTELQQRFPNPDEIEKEADKKAFAKLFGEYLRVENVLQNYDEFASLKALQSLDMTDSEAVEAFKALHYLNDDDLQAMREIEMPAERKIQDYRSTYNDIHDWLRQQKVGAEKAESTIDWDDVVFEVDLLKSQEINLDYILELIFEHHKKTRSKTELVDEVRRVIRASLGHRAKESLLVDFINQTDLDQIGDKASVIDAFFTFAQAEQKREAEELIGSEGLNEEAAKRYIVTSLKREFASDNGTELNAILPKMSPLNPQYLPKKQSVFQKIAAFVEKFKGVGGKV